MTILLKAHAVSSAKPTKNHQHIHIASMLIQVMWACSTHTDKGNSTAANTWHWGTIHFFLYGLKVSTFWYVIKNREKERFYNWIGMAITKMQCRKTK